MANPNTETLAGTVNSWQGSAHADQNTPRNPATDPADDSAPTGIVPELRQIKAVVRDSLLNPCWIEYTGLQDAPGAGVLPLVGATSPVTLDFTGNWANIAVVGRAVKFIDSGNTIYTGVIATVTPGDTTLVTLRAVTGGTPDSGSCQHFWFSALGSAVQPGQPFPLVLAPVAGDTTGALVVPVAGVGTGNAVGAASGFVDATDATTTPIDTTVPPQDQNVLVFTKTSDGATEPIGKWAPGTVGGPLGALTAAQVLAALGTIVSPDTLASDKADAILGLSSKGITSSLGPTSGWIKVPLGDVSGAQVWLVQYAKVIVSSGSLLPYMVTLPLPMPHLLFAVGSATVMSAPFAGATAFWDGNVSRTDSDQVGVYVGGGWQAGLPHYVFVLAIGY